MKLAAYLRVSTDRQAVDGLGLDVQERAVRDWARRNGHRIEAIYRDEGVSGSNGVEERVALPEVIAAVEGHEVAGVIVANLDRLARKLTTQEAILGRLWDAGAHVFTADEGEVLEDDPSDPMRTALRQIRGVFHQLDRAMIAKRLREGRQAKSAAGGYAYGSPPLGTRSKDGTLIEEPDEAATVALIRELHAQGLSLRAIADELERQGRKTKRGGTWWPSTVAKVLRRAS
jgi:DNA invertase Pin-like site-specific DNA recombinase